MFILFHSPAEFRPVVKIKIETSPAVRRFNFLVGVFDLETGGKFDRVPPEKIIEWCLAHGFKDRANELRDLVARIYPSYPANV